MRFKIPFAAAAAVFIAAISLMPLSAQAAAPAPAKPVELKKYVGRWYEVARVPNQFEKGTNCEAPNADYEQDAKGAVTVVQTCHQKAPNGPEKTYKASAQILDPGVNAKFKLIFYVVVARDYWVLDHAQDYSWAIVGDPTGKYLWLFSRQPAVSPVVRSVMLARARTLGYDTAKLEFPQEG
jgi:apolipoprotein D and lipocalin family protein